MLVIDHQSRLQAGQSYQNKGAFGSVYKANLARSVIQVEATERGEGTLTVRLRQKKHNFGPLAEPFGVKLSFSEEAVTLEAVELKAAELAEEADTPLPGQGDAYRIGPGPGSTQGKSGIDHQRQPAPTGHCNKKATPWEVARPGDVVRRLYGTPISLPTPGRE